MNTGSTGTEKTTTVRVGVDVGGTFTDLVLQRDGSLDVILFKLPSTPDNPANAIVSGLRAIVDLAGSALEGVRFLGHGTTVATNAVIQRTWARTGLITTQGFRDVIEIRRQQRPDTYDLRVPKPEPIATRDLRLEVPERVRADGSIRTPLDEGAVRGAVRRLVGSGVEAIAICFIHSYAHPDHEAAAVRIARDEAPGVYMSASFEVASEFREYPRVSTTLVNAALGPNMARYLGSLAEQTRDAGVAEAPRIMLSNGGIASVATAVRSPVRTLGSGPTAGVIAAIATCGPADFPNMVTFDVGGTSTDVCLVEDGRPATTSEKTTAGYPVRGAVVDVHSVGAGGGSIAWLDLGGFLQVGPRSAGAFPGPACYRRGGTLPTVTDANLILGRLNPDHLLAGRMALDSDAARQAIREHVADPLGLSVVDAASAILRVVNANMIQAIRLISVERGYDPRNFALVAFGGAGPLHMVEVAQELGFHSTVAPIGPGVLSALGLLASDIRADFSRTHAVVLANADPEAVEQVFTELEDRARTWVAGDAPGRPCRLNRALDMRYVGQSFELTVPAPDGAIGHAQLQELERRFYAEHEHVYGYFAEAPTEIVTFRVTATAIIDKPETAPLALRVDEPVAPTARRLVHFGSTGFVPSPVYQRTNLWPGARLEGPAIVEQEDATTVLPPGVVAQVDAYQNLVVQLSPRQS